MDQFKTKLDMISQTKYILWDWNGTLLDDVHTCIASMNEILVKKDMEQISPDRYKEIFDFPVINYYRKLGFDLGHFSFEKLSVEFMAGYHKRVSETRLYDSVEDVLKFFSEHERVQVIISAMEQNSLENMLESRNIRHYFKDVKGLNDIYANGKTHLATDYLKEHAIDPDDVVLIGDTLHDFEVANQVGCKCILIANGHQSYERLLQTGTKVLNQIDELIALL